MIKKSETTSRHQMLSENTAQTSITMNKAILAKAKAKAKREGRSLSNWLNQMLLKHFESQEAERPADKAAADER